MVNKKTVESIKGMVVFISILVFSGAAGHIYALSDYGLDGRYYIDLLGSSICLFFLCGIALRFITYRQEVKWRRNESR